MENLKNLFDKLLENLKKIRIVDLIIIVGVDLDTMSQIEGYLKMYHYDGIVKKGKIRSRNF